MSTPVSSPTERELIDLMRTHTPRLWPVACAFASADAEAEDLLQELWITVHERWEQRPRDGDAGAWLHVVLLNLGRARYRRQSRRARLLRWWRPHDELSTAAPDTTVFAHLQRHALWRAVADLPRLQRDVLVRRLVSDESTRDVASALGVAEGTVKASLHRALRTLRTKLEIT